MYIYYVFVSGIKSSLHSFIYYLLQHFFIIFALSRKIISYNTLNISLVPDNSLKIGLPGNCIFAKIANMSLSHE